MSNDSSKQTDSHSDFPAKGPQVPWGPVSAILVYVLTFFGVQFLIALIVIAVFKIFGLSGGAGEWFTTIQGQFVFVLASDAFILLSIGLFLRHRRGNFGQLGLGRRPLWRDAKYALIGYVVYYFLGILLVLLMDALTQINLNQRQELGFDNLFGSTEKIIALISLVILPPIVEEIVFRGFVYTGLRKKLKFVWATLITSLMFASLHLMGSSDGLLWVAGIDTLALSFILCYLREKTGALWAPMAVHAFKNSIAFVLLLSGVVAL